MTHEPPAKAASAGYAICGEQRSGSTYLGQLLRSTGMLGTPHDYFNTASRRRDQPAYPHDPARQVDAVLAGATPNGIYGLKVFPQEFEQAVASRWAERLPALSFVFLTRRDKLGQAISAERARQTGQWFSTDGAARAVRYDAQRITRMLHAIVVSEARWEAYWARNAIVPLRLTYEEIVAEPQTAVTAIARLVGLSAAPVVQIEQASLRQQRDDRSDDWRARYRADAGDRSVIDPLHAVSLRRWARDSWPRFAETITGLRRRR